MSTSTPAPAATGPADPLLPRPPGGLAPGAALALAVHVGLIAALTFSVDWRVKPVAVASAELWAAVPQQAAPPAAAPEPPAPVPEPQTPPPPPPPAPRPAPPPPPPPSRDAQIATERAEQRAREQQQREAAERERAQRAERERERERAEQAAKARAERAERAERERRERQAAEEARRARAAEEARIARLREEQLKRMQGALGASGAGAPGSTGSAERDAAPSQDYVNRLIARLRQNVVWADTSSANPAVEIEVRAAPGGTIIGRRIVKPSGVPEWDEAALRAVDRTGTLPRQADGRVPPVLIVVFRPKE